MNTQTYTVKAVNCISSGAIVAANEATQVVRCGCGFVVEAEPRWNRKSAGQVVEGWTVRIPVHKR